MKRLMTLLMLGALLGGVVLALILSPAPQGKARAQVFATNTPRPPDFLAGSPDAPLERYALRLWTREDLLTLLLNQLERLADGQAEQAAPVRYTQYELARRFPDYTTAPSDRRAQIVNAMLRAPRGTVDMRAFLRPYVVDLFNARINAFPSPETTVRAEGFDMQLTTLNLDGMRAVDGLLAVTYPAEPGAEGVRYQDYVPVIAATNGYALPELPADHAAAPYDTVREVSLVAAEDINRDGLAEIVLRVNTETLNDRLQVIGWRAGEMIDLVQPDETMRLDSQSEPSITPGRIDVSAARRASARWDCVSRLDVTWTYQSNQFRPSTPLNADYAPLDTAACALYTAEPPIYAQEPANAASVAAEIVANNPPDARGHERAVLTLAVLQTMAGQASAVGDTLARLEGQIATNPDLRAQAAALRGLADDPNVTDVDICAAVVNAAPDAVCAMDDVIARTLANDPVPRGADVEAALQERSLPVVESFTVEEVGRAPREVVRFALPGAGWWAFAPTDPDVYVAEPTDPPAAYNPLTAMNPGPVSIPAQARAALFEADRPSTALTILENVESDMPGRTLTDEARFFNALSLDLLGDRAAARQAYYTLWRDATGTTWGQLAGAHLERR